MSLEISRSAWVVLVSLCAVFFGLNNYEHFQEKAGPVALGRQPAAVAAPVMQAVALSSTLEINCKDSDYEVQSSSDSVRVVLPKCLKGKPSKVTNQINGFSASLFVLQDGRFSTDYMTATPGSNPLKIETNKESRTITIYRPLDASL